MRKSQLVLVEPLLQEAVPRSVCWEAFSLLSLLVSLGFVVGIIPCSSRGSTKRLASQKPATTMVSDMYSNRGSRENFFENVVFEAATFSKPRGVESLFK